MLVRSNPVGQATGSAKPPISAICVHQLLYYKFLLVPETRVGDRYVGRYFQGRNSVRMVCVPEVKTDVRG